MNKPTRIIDYQISTDPLENPDQCGAEILRAYHDQRITSGGLTNRIAVVGTGGQGLWERSWSKRAGQAIAEDPWSTKSNPSGSPPRDRENHHLRAMAFAHDLGTPLQAKMTDLEMALFSHTTTGIRQREILESHIRQPNLHPHLGRNEPSDAEVQTASFIRNHPDNWEYETQAHIGAATDLLDLGKHLAYLGMIESSRSLAGLGYKIMSAAPDRLQNALAEKTEDRTFTAMGEARESARRETPTTPNQQALRAMQYLDEAINTASIEDDETANKARVFLAEAVVAWESGRRQQKMMDLTWSQPQEGIGIALRNLSDHAFQNDGMNLQQMLTADLAEGITNGATCWYQQMDRLEQIIEVGLTNQEYIATRVQETLQEINTMLNEENILDAAKWLKSLAKTWDTAADGAANGTNPQAISYINLRMGQAYHQGASYCKARENNMSGESNNPNMPHPRVMMNNHLEAALVVASCLELAEKSKT